MGETGSLRRAGGALVALCSVVVLTVWLVAARAGSSGAEPASWGLTQMRAPEAWRVSTGQGITIGVVDSGVDPASPGLLGKVVQSADCIGSGGVETGCRAGYALDSFGHGSLVASVAGQVAPGARFVAARAIGPSRMGGDDDIAAAIDWVVSHGAQVVNVSLAVEEGGVVSLSPRLQEAVQKAWARGAVPVLAAGNEGGDSPYGTLDALTVAATTPTGSIAPYSSRTNTAKWGLAAPGSVTAVLSRGRLVTHSGTSVAAPNAAGAVALLLAHGERREAAIQRLLTTAVLCTGCGYGRIDVAAALGIAVPPPAPPTTVAPPPPEPDLSIPDPSLLDRAPTLDDSG
jgi:subtilisin family serine protease